MLEINLIKDSILIINNIIYHILSNYYKEMEQIIIKTENNPDDEILLYYVDDDGGNESVITTVESTVLEEIDDERSLHQNALQQESFILSDLTPKVECVEKTSIPQPNWNNERWTSDDIKKLLTFYIDNKTTFVGGYASKKHLWTVACKTMLIGKNVKLCETKIQNLKEIYINVRKEQITGKNISWTYFDYCHQAFHDDDFVNKQISQMREEHLALLSIEGRPVKSNYEGIIINRVPPTPSVTDVKVERMLDLFIKYKKEYERELKDDSQKTLKFIWHNIAAELGEENGEYWQRRFYHFKYQYIKMLEKRAANKDVNWPYMKVFDEIFQDDNDFNRRHGTKKGLPPLVKVIPSDTKIFADIKQKTEIGNNIYTNTTKSWNNTEMTVLAKYYFECFYEFQDPTIPNQFLWNEIGRLLDKTPESCQNKYNELKKDHLDKYVNGQYDINQRIPVAILYDNIIAREVQLDFDGEKTVTKFTKWEDQIIDMLVQYFYQNILLFKDKICHFVCWAAISLKLNHSVHECKHQWNNLTELYQSFLKNKKESPDLQIDWRYIELFDKIFDYGMDTKLINGYEISLKQPKVIDFDKMTAKITPKGDSSQNVPDVFQSKVTTSKRYPKSEPQIFRLLNFYITNKEKFRNNRYKHFDLWQGISTEIGLTPKQCSHKLRNLKLAFVSLVRKELSNPEKPIIWPYYALCKKAFGYRAIKSKLNKYKVSDDEDDWSSKEINQLIKYFALNFDDITNDINDKSKWGELSKAIGKTKVACNEKFLELRKSYKKMKLTKSRYPNMEITWRYFKLFDEIYECRGLLGKLNKVQPTKDDIADEDYQCIIVLPEGEELTNDNAKVLVERQTLTEIEDQSIEIYVDMNEVDMKMDVSTDNDTSQSVTYYTSDISNSQSIIL